MASRAPKGGCRADQKYSGHKNPHAAIW